MSNISVIILTKDSQDSLLKALQSVDFCQEIIIIDSNSTDSTLQIAKKYTQKIYSDSTLDFAKKRELGLTKAANHWVLYLDADEIVSGSLKKQIEEAIKREEYAAYNMQRKNFYLGNHPWPYQETVTRLFQKKHLKGWIGILHESPNVEGKIGNLDSELLHYTHRDLVSMLEKTNQWSKIESELRFNAHHPKMLSWRFFRVFLTGFFDYYLKQGGWKVGTVGLIESIYQGFSLFITYAKLWELQQRSSK